MEIKLYQIDKDAADGKSFDGLDFDEHKELNEGDLREDLYSLVTEYYIYERGSKEDFEKYFGEESEYGRLRQGDIIDVYDCEDLLDGSYFVNITDGRFEYKNCSFDPENVVMKAVLINPLEEPKEITLRHTLGEMQAAVGGLIEPIYLDDNIVCIVNDEGKINGMLPNRAMRDEEGNIVDVSFGPMLFLRDNGTDFCTLKQNDVKMIMEKFKYPEVLIMINGEPVTIKLTPEEVKEFFGDKEKPKEKKRSFSAGYDR